MSTGIRVCSLDMIALTGVVRAVRRMVDNLQVPTGWWAGLTTNTSQKSVGRSSVERK